MSTVLYSDLIQIDKILYRLKTKIISQRKEILTLKEEITQLRNRPESIESQPPKVIITGQKSKINLEKPIEQWGSAHFLKYFQQKYQQKYKANRKFSSEDWRMNALRVHNFLQRHADNLTKSDYVNFINWLFKKKASKTFILTIGNIVSDVHFCEWKDVVRGTKYGDFTATKKQLKNNIAEDIDIESLFQDFGV